MPAIPKTIRKLAMATALPAALFATDAFAQRTASVDIFVDLTVQDGCVINGDTSSNSTLSFGTIQNPGTLAVNITAQGQPINVVCNVDSTTATFQIDNGNNDSAGIHRLASPTPLGGGPRFINYHVYARPNDPSSEYLIGTPIPIGGGVLGGPLPGAITAGVPFNIILHGTILNADAVGARADIYSDTLRGVLTF